MMSSLVTVFSNFGEISYSRNSNSKAEAGWVWWHMSAFPVTGEAQAGEFKLGLY